MIRQSFMLNTLCMMFNTGFLNSYLSFEKGMHGYQKRITYCLLSFGLSVGALLILQPSMRTEKHERCS